MYLVVIHNADGSLSYIEGTWNEIADLVCDCALDSPCDCGTYEFHHVEHVSAEG